MEKEEEDTGVGSPLEEEAKEVDWKEEEEGDTGAGSPLEEVEKVLCFAAPRSQVRRTRTSGQIRPQVRALEQDSCLSSAYGG